MTQYHHGRLIYIGTTAERGSTSPPATKYGLWFWDTDLSALYYWDGSSWASISAGGGPFVLLAGDEMTGNLLITNASAAVLELAGVTESAILILNSGTDGLGSELSAVYFKDNDTTKWIVGKFANSFKIDDAVRGQTSIEITEGGSGELRLMQVDGKVIIGGTGAVARLHVIGAANHQQFIVQAHSVQTANILEIQKVDDIVYSGFDKVGVLFFAEITTPTAVPDFGKMYTKSDNELYFQDGAGAEHIVDVDGGGDGLTDVSWLEEELSGGDSESEPCCGLADGGDSVDEPCCGPLDGGDANNEFIIHKTNRVTTTHAVLDTDNVLFANTDGGGYTVTLPVGVEGRTLKIINSGSSANLLVVVPNGTEHLLGVNSSFNLADGETLIISYNVNDGWY